MSKELEALKIMVKDNDLELPYHNTIQAIETALKRLELQDKEEEQIMQLPPAKVINNENGTISFEGQENILFIHDKERYEKPFKALEIIKKCCLVSAYPNNTYELAFTNKIEITKEEYDLLKEVLL